LKTAKQAKRAARQLFRICLVGGALDESRARGIVRKLLDARRPGTLPILSRFQRLVRIDRTQHRAEVTSAAPLTPDLRAKFAAFVERRWGHGMAIAFGEDPALLGGVRITVGSEVYDGSVRAALAALQSRFERAQA
jgi:F-type H+-transporting ATPase subunit delta